MSLTWKFPEELLVLSPGNTSSAIRNATATGQIHYGGDGEPRAEGGEASLSEGTAHTGKVGLPTSIKTIGTVLQAGLPT